MASSRYVGTAEEGSPHFRQVHPDRGEVGGDQLLPLRPVLEVVEIFALKPKPSTSTSESRPPHLHPKEPLSVQPLQGESCAQQQARRKGLVGL